MIEVVTIGDSDRPSDGPCGRSAPWRGKSFGTGINIHEYMPNLKRRKFHLQYGSVVAGREARKIVEVTDWKWNDQGMHMKVRLANAVCPQLSYSVEFYDLFIFENGPQALMRFYRKMTPRRQAELTQHPRVSEFLVEIFSHLDRS